MRHNSMLGDSPDKSYAGYAACKLIRALSIISTVSPLIHQLDS